MTNTCDSWQMMDQVVDLYLKAKLVGLFEETTLGELKHFNRNWKSLMSNLYAQPQELASEESDQEGDDVQADYEQENCAKTIDELEDILMKAEQVLAKSNQIISGQQKPTSEKQTVQPAFKTHSTRPVNLPVKKTAADPKEVKTSRLSSGPAVKPLTNAHRPAHMSAPFKTQPLNLFGNKRPQFPPVKRPSVAAKTAQTCGDTNKFVRSNSASSVQSSAAVQQQHPSVVPERKSLANPPSTSFESLESGPNTQLAQMVKEVRIGGSHVNAQLKVKATAPKISSQEKSRRENQLLTVKNIHNSLRDNLELKRKVLLAARKPSASRAVFLNKVQSMEPVDSKAAVCSTSVFKVHQSSVLYQRLACLIRKQMTSSTDTSDLAGKHGNQQLKQLLGKMKQADRLIIENLESGPGENLIDGGQEAPMSGYLCKNYLFPMLAFKLAEVYYEKPGELRTYNELLCQRWDLDLSTCLLNLIKSGHLPNLNSEFCLKNMDQLVKLLGSIVHFISSGSTKRTVFVDEN